ncbi:competence type IV pilus minor pilin ComGG [Vagococcus elongatus]|nr:competence type IV pilus minor pilin ComGG [Vagococcus elongatus]
MKKSRSRKKYTGGILLSVIVLFTMYLFIFQLIHRQYLHQQAMVIEAQKFYQLKILKEMSIQWIEAGEMSGEGTIKFNKGKVTYKVEPHQIKLVATLNSKESKTMIHKKD